MPQAPAPALPMPLVDAGCWQYAARDAFDWKSVPNTACIRLHRGSGSVDACMQPWLSFFDEAQYDASLAAAVRCDLLLRDASSRLMRRGTGGAPQVGGKPTHEQCSSRAGLREAGDDGHKVCWTKGPLPVSATKPGRLASVIARSPDSVSQTGQSADFTPRFLEIIWLFERSAVRMRGVPDAAMRRRSDGC